MREQSFLIVLPFALFVKKHLFRPAGAKQLLSSFRYRLNMPGEPPVRRRLSLPYIKKEPEGSLYLTGCCSRHYETDEEKTGGMLLSQDSDN